MSRLFTFGDSATQYKWPTWADIISKNFDHFENWGRMGVGNLYIFNALNECVIRNKINEKDTVIIQWGVITRDDLYVKNTWQVVGGPLDHPVITCNIKSPIATVDERGHLIRDMALIHSAKLMLERINCKHIIISVVPMKNSKHYQVSIANDVDDVLEFYKDSIDSIRPSIFEKIYNFDWNFRSFTTEEHTYKYIKKIYNKVKGQSWPSYDKFVKKEFTGLSADIINELKTFYQTYLVQEVPRIDHHPTPIEALEYVKEILPEFTVSKETEKWISELDVKVRQFQPIDWNPVLPNRL